MRGSRVSRSPACASAGSPRGSSPGFSPVRGSRLSRKRSTRSRPTSYRSTPGRIPTPIMRSAMEAGAHVFVEKPWPTMWPTPRGWSRRAAHRPQARRGLYPAAPSVVDALHRDRQDLGAPLVFRMNLNQQSSGPPGRRTSACCNPLADRRLRRALRGRHVPDHPGEARAGARRRGAPDRGHAGRACTITAIST